MKTNQEVAVIVLANGPQKPVSEHKRFALLVLGSVGCIVCSFSYAWNLISGEMQKRYNLSQRDLSTVSTVGLVFQFAVLPYAFLYDYLGPMPVSIIGTTYFPLGTLLLALCFMGKIEGSVLRLSVFNAMMACGCTMFDLISCVTVLSHFPTNRGPVTAVMKTYTGLGTALIACLHAGFFNHNPLVYFFFLFSMALLVGVLCVIFMRLPPYHLTGYDMSHLPEEVKESRLATKAQYLRQEAPLRRFVFGFVIVLILFVFLPVQSALVSYMSLGTTPKLAFAIVATVLVFVYFFLMTPLRCLDSSHIPYIHPVEEEEDEMTHQRDGRAEAGSYQTLNDWQEAGSGCGNAPDGSPAAEKVQGFDKDGRRMSGMALAEASATMSEATANVEAVKTEIDYLAPQYQGTFFHNLGTPELWGLWWTSFVTMGCTFVVIFNPTYMLAALQSAPVDASLRTMLTVLSGVGSALGRMLMAVFEMWTQKRKAEDRIPITMATLFSTGCVILSIVLFLVLPAAALPLPYIVAATGNGFYNGVMLLVTRTIYAQDPAKHYHFCFSALVLSAIVFNRFLYGEWYTVQAEKQARSDQMCYGKKCVMMPLLVMLGLACSSLIAEAFVNLRYRSYCIKTLAARAQLHAAAAQGEVSPCEPCNEEPAASSSSARAAADADEEERQRA